MIRVAQVRKGSIGADLDIQVGSSLLRLNGEELRDALDLQYLEAAELVELEAELPGGRHVTYEIEKDGSESLGLVPEADLIRRCTNACPFCFVKGNPKTERLRTTLYIKDDDYRLSFMYGHYVTLTNLREEDWERIEEQRLSPLFVSVHATDPEARAKMLVNPRSREINEQLDRLEAAGIAFHAQAVLCPGVNDGPVLDRTIIELYERGDSVLSLSVVPVGLTRFNQDSGIRVATPGVTHPMRCSSQPGWTCPDGSTSTTRSWSATVSERSPGCARPFAQTCRTFPALPGARSSSPPAPRWGRPWRISVASCKLPAARRSERSRCPTRCTARR
jgi:putative radical SAM enzyme (TIGR03279 family)